jgi:hypothetical protein
MENLINLVAASFARNGMANGIGRNGVHSPHRVNGKGVGNHLGNSLGNLGEPSRHTPSLTTALPEHFLEHNLRRAPQDDPAP